MRVPALVVLALLIAPAAAYAAAVSPTDIRSEIDSKGAAQTILLLKKQSQWDDVLRQIETGKTAWLKLAPSFRAAAGQADADALDMALGKAIKRNPSGVLRLVGHGVSAEHVCKNHDANTKADQLRQFRAETEKALRRVQDATLKDERDHCLKTLYTRADSTKVGLE